MDKDTLTALQAPLKERYRDDAGSALITLKASGRLGEGVSCSLDTGKAMAEAGLHPAAGGDGVTLKAVATSLGLAVSGGSVRAEGDLDFRGTLAVDRDAPVGFRAIRLAFEVETDATPEQLATLAKLTERYCVVWQSLRQPPEGSVTVTAVA